MQDMAVTWLGDNANSATNELAWYPPPSVERKAPASHEKDAFGEAEMLCLMAMRNPMLMSIISQLQRTALAEAWHLRMAAALALGKIAVMSEEPFRIHCYTLLAALSGSKAHDPLGMLSPLYLFDSSHLIDFTDEYHLDAAVRGARGSVAPANGSGHRVWKIDVMSEEPF
jgi:hypothetical protein